MAHPHRDQKVLTAAEVVEVLEQNLERDVDRLYIGPGTWVPRGWMRIQLLESLLQQAELAEDYDLCARTQNLLSAFRERYGVEATKAGVSKR